MCLCDAFCRFDLLWNLRRREATVEIPFAVSEDGRQGFVYADKLFFNRECVLTVSDIYSEKYYISVVPYQDDNVLVTLCGKREEPMQENILRSFMNDLIDYQVRLDLQKEFGDLRKRIIEYAFSPVK